MRKTLLIAGLCGVLALPLISCQRGSNAGGGGESAQAETVVVPEGTSLLVSLQEPLSTATNIGGDTFQATLMEPVMAEGRAVLPTGSVVTGTVLQVKTPGEGGEMGRMVLTLTSANPPSGEPMRLGTNSLELIAEPSTEDDLEKVAAGGVAGGVIGGVLGGGKGALVGAVAGAGAGTVVAILTQDKDVHVDAGQKMEFSLVKPAEFPLLAAAVGR